ncbi:MAG: hypothetical protein JJD93_16010 [Ilumatobacteraceae bacterium]|nr:hypothetical protein [Ilumatobacteraceae bacterium]
MNEFTAPAVRFVERMIESADDEVVNVAMLSVGAPLHWNGDGIARAAFESPLLSINMKAMIRRS